MQESAPYYNTIFKKGNKLSHLDFYQHSLEKARELNVDPSLKTLADYQKDSCLLFAVVGEANKGFLTIETLLLYYRRQVELSELLLTVVQMKGTTSHHLTELHTQYYSGNVISMVCLENLETTEALMTMLITHNLKYEHMFVSQEVMLEDLIYILSEDGIKALGEKYEVSMKIAAERKRLPLEKGDVDLFVSLSTTDNMANNQLIYSNLTTLLQREEPTHVGDILILFINSKQISSVEDGVFRYTGNIYQSLKLQFDFMKPTLLNLLPGHKPSDEIISFHIDDKDTGIDKQITIRKLTKNEIANTMNYLERFDELSSNEKELTLDSVKDILKRIDV